VRACVEIPLHCQCLHARPVDRGRLSWP
jgi:hypothetical protein